MKVGFLGTGNITQKVGPTLKRTEGIECYAAASRTLEKAEAFCRKVGFEKAYGSYEAMLEDPEVELVYVASPHSHHFEHMMLCLEHGKNVLCEKPFTLNAGQARKIRDAAAERHLFAAEAIWTRYMPSRGIIEQLLTGGAIGEVKALTANLFYHNEHRERISDPALAGGALLDLGVYGINFARMFFGPAVDRIESSVQMTDTGVDGMESITMFFRDGRMALLSAGITSRSDRQGVFYGTKGYMIVENINNPQSVSVYDDADHLLQKVTVPEQITGYEYEFIECARAIREGRPESWSMPLEETIRVMETMDALRAQWGFVYPQEKE